MQTYIIFFHSSYVTVSYVQGYIENRSLLTFLSSVLKLLLKILDKILYIYNDIYVGVTMSVFS